MANKPFKKLRFSLTGDTYSPVDEQARQSIGDLSQLDTEHKDNLVEAINEAAQSGGGGTGVPSGGSKGQVLTKRSSVEGDAGWEYPPVMYASGNDPSNLSVSWNENYTVMDFFMRQSIVQAEYEDAYVVHLKLIKAYITAVAPNFTSVYHFLFGAIANIDNGTASFGTLEVVCDNASAHTGVGVYSEVEIGVSEETIQDAVDNYLELHPSVGGAFSNAAKRALLDLLEQVAYVVDNGQDYLDALEREFFDVRVSSITAVFTQGSAVIYDTDSLDTLRQYLVVTANYSDGTSSIVSAYSLSGTLTEGTSTITVSYEDKTTTFNAIVTRLLPEGYTKLQYVATNGNQYVDTGLNETQTTKAEYEIAITSQPKVNGNHILSSTNTYFPFLKGSSTTDSDWKTRCGGKLRGNEIFTQSGIAVINFPWEFNRRYVISGYPEVTIDGTNIDSLTVGATSSASNKLCLFTYGGATTNTTYRFYGKMYWCKIYDASNNLLRDFIPSKNSSNVVGLYDRVTGTFYTSSTQTALIAGEVE